MSDRTFNTTVSPLLRAWQAHDLAGSAVAAPHVPRSAVSPGAGLWATLRAAWLRQRSRRGLAELDARTLKDIGVSFAEAEAEANKPFWVP